MRPFAYEPVRVAEAAVQIAAQGRGESPLQNPIQFLAGGTTLIDLMKLDVMRPSTLVDINALDQTELGRIEMSPDGLRLGAMVRMTAAAEHPGVNRDFPAIAMSLKLAASQQLRNMASLGGNVLQRTRCPYFRDVSYAACNKRNPGSGCAALDGFNRAHAVLGASESCIASYPGDFAQALIAFDATMEIAGVNGKRSIPFAALHRRPGDRPDIETTLQSGEMIASFFVPGGPWTRRSLYLKIRDRESYEFALASAAVALDLRDGTLREARIALGGVATVPWRATSAEAALKGKAIDDASARQAAAEAAFAGAQAREHNAFKIELGKRTLLRALAEAAQMKV
ncbi:MAG: xanthine dehydrogenase YagS FAD-binding subunit [Alphaproteobacteria bacterium]|jgi:xanthine dehydrogenase YagS FAD-binding subunit|nr:xanthine dehydrogenase YagS FAD-binding subunit [Alphaproteobacteria bacterium]